MSKKKKDRVEKGEVSIRLKCELSLPEMNQTAKQLSDSIGEVKKQEDEIAVIKKNYKSKIDLLNGEVVRLARIYRDGYEYRDVLCMMVLNFKAGERQYLDQVSQEILKTEPLQDPDYQLPLELKEKEKKK